jgi:hypothetical protein
LNVQSQWREDYVRRRAGWLLNVVPAPILAQDQTQYHVYANTGAADPINYSSPIATVNGLSWTISALSYPGTWSFGVRAFDTLSGLEEQNLDCAVTIVLDSTGNDISDQPSPPKGTRAFALAGGAIRVEWTYPMMNNANQPTGFYVYIGTGGSPNYAAPAATVPFASSIAKTFVANLAGLTDSITSSIGVRAFNSTTIEGNTSTVSVTANAVGPAAVADLTAIATASS